MVSHWGWCIVLIICGTLSRSQPYTLPTPTTLPNHTSAVVPDLADAAANAIDKGLEYLVGAFTDALVSTYVDALTNVTQAYIKDTNMTAAGLESFLRNLNNETNYLTVSAHNGTAQVSSPTTLEGSPRRHLGIFGDLVGLVQTARNVRRNGGGSVAGQGESETRGSSFESAVDQGFKVLDGIRKEMATAKKSGNSNFYTLFRKAAQDAITDINDGTIKLPQNSVGIALRNFFQTLQYEQSGGKRQDGVDVLPKNMQPASNLRDISLGPITTPATQTPSKSPVYHVRQPTTKQTDLSPRVTTESMATAEIQHKGQAVELQEQDQQQLPPPYQNSSKEPAPARQLFGKWRRARFAALGPAATEEPALETTSTTAPLLRQQVGIRSGLTDLERRAAMENKIHELSLGPLGDPENEQQEASVYDPPPVPPTELVSSDLKPKGPGLGSNASDFFAELEPIPNEVKGDGIPVETRRGTPLAKLNRLFGDD